MTNEELKKKWSLTRNELEQVFRDLGKYESGVWRLPKQAFHLLILGRIDVDFDRNEKLWKEFCADFCLVPEHLYHFEEHRKIWMYRMLEPSEFALYVQASNERKNNKQSKMPQMNPYQKPCKLCDVYKAEHQDWNRDDEDPVMQNPEKQKRDELNKEMPKVNQDIDDPVLRHLELHRHEMELENERKRQERIERLRPYWWKKSEKPSESNDDDAPEIPKGE